MAHKPYVSKLAAALLAALGAAPMAARAATIQVVTPDDPTGDGTSCTLRQAIAAMNAASTAGTGCIATGGFGSGDTVAFAASARAGSAGANTLTLADLVASTLSIGAHDLTLSGLGADGAAMTVQRPAGATNKFGIVYDSAPANGSLTVVGLTLANGNVPGPSGTPGTCSGAANYGGGISMKNGAALTLIASSVSGNTAKWGGGGIFSEGDITLSGSTISGNSTQHSGGGIFGCIRTGALKITNSTISGNTASQWGGGIGIYHAQGSITIVNSTIAANSAGSAWYGGGILLRNAYAAVPVKIDNTIVSGNRIGNSENNVYAAIAAGNVDGSFTTQKTITGAGNLVYQGTKPLDPSKSLIAFADAPIMANPQLTALGPNGGPTQTMMPQPGSPALNAVSCANAPPTDQRGMIRPDPASRGSATPCDIGAVEANSISDEIFKDGFGL